MLAEIIITDAWIRQLPPVVPARAGYATFTNSASLAEKIRSIKSSFFVDIEIHHTVEKDGSMRMQLIDSLDIPGKGQIKFAPGSIHLMMMQPAQVTKIGQKIPVKVIFESGQQQTVIFEVRK
ncbi:MAG: copper(I)-binding protein [Gammaproteobacteria bacterium]